jgi:hypothetical protein
MSKKYLSFFRTYLCTVHLRMFWNSQSVCIMYVRARVVIRASMHREWWEWKPQLNIVYTKKERLRRQQKRSGLFPMYFLRPPSTNRYNVYYCINVCPAIKITRNDAATYRCWVRWKRQFTCNDYPVSTQIYRSWALLNFNWTAREGYKMKNTLAFNGLSQLRKALLRHL